MVRAILCVGAFVVGLILQILFHKSEMAFYESQLYELPWLYALWQWTRSKKVVVCLIRLVTGLLSQLFARKGSCIERGRNICKIVQGINDSRNWDDDVVGLSPDVNDLKDAFVFGYRRHVMDGEQFLELGDRKMLLTTHSMICSIKRLEGQQFVVEHMHVVGKLTTAMPISDEEAIVLLANGHCAVTCAGETLIMSSYSDVNRSFIDFSMLATLPLVLQVKGYSLVAVYLSIAILAMDLLRTPISKLFNNLSDYIIIWVQLHVLRRWSQGYELLSIFSSAWLYSDQEEKCVYKSKGPFYCSYGSLVTKDGFALYNDEPLPEHMFKIDGERAQWLPTLSVSNLGVPFLFHNEILIG